MVNTVVAIHIVLLYMTGAMMFVNSSKRPVMILFFLEISH